MTSPRGPNHLSLPARRLFSEVLRLYELEPHDQAVLVKALEAWDRAEQSRQRIDTDGLTVKSRFGELKPHPLLSSSAIRGRPFWPACGSSASTMSRCPTRRAPRLPVRLGGRDETPTPDPRAEAAPELERSARLRG
jgi:hypothetical protein